MYEDYLIRHVVNSLVFGVSLGLLIGLAGKRPKGWKAFWALAGLGLLSPWIGVDTVMFWDSCATSNVTGMHFPPFLLALTATLCLCFLGRTVFAKWRARAIPVTD